MSCNNVLYDSLRNEYFCGKFKSGICEELKCRAINNIKNENGFNVDYRHVYYGEAKDGSARWGWRIFDTNFTFIGLLDENKLAIWYVDEQSLVIEEHNK